MEKNKNYATERVITNSTSYEKEFAWEITNFIDWWSSREVVPSNRNQNTTEMEEMMDEEPTDWDKSSCSPMMTFQIEGITHQFKIAILKYDDWDRYDDEHNVMMGISLFYNGPFESVILKPVFYTKRSGKSGGRPLQTETLKKGMYSGARVFSSGSIISNLNANDPFVLLCLAKIFLYNHCSTTLDLENTLKSKKTWNQCLLDGFNFSSTSTHHDNLSDFEIVCVEKADNGEHTERRFKCHKLVLSLSSQYYENMFSSNFSETQGSTKVTDVSQDTMAKMLQYIYTGMLEENEIDIEVFYVADKYQLEYLKALCELELGKNITLETAPQLAVAASVCGSDTFKRHVYGFIEKRWSEIESVKGVELITKKMPKTDIAEIGKEFSQR